MFMVFRVLVSSAALAAAVLPRGVTAVSVRSQTLTVHHAEAAASTDEAQAAASGLDAIQFGPPTSTARLHHLLSTLDKFRDFALGSRRGVQERHVAEDSRLAESMNMTRDEGVKFALNRSRATNQQARLESERIYDNMVRFTESMTTLLKAADSKGTVCEGTTCGPHASCTDTMAGAQCVCNEGYVGTGHDCHAPLEFRPHRVLYEGEAGVATTAHGINVCVFELNKIAIVFVDATRGSIGRMVVGSVREAGLADLAPPEQINLNGKVYDPVVAGSQDKHILVAWRDQNRNAASMMRGVTMGKTGIRGASMALTWGQPELFSTGQAHKMALISLDANRFLVLYPDIVMATVHTPMEKFGNSLLVGVGVAGDLHKLGHYRFCDFPVVRLEVTKVAPKAFVLAARGAKTVDDVDPSQTLNQEAIAIYGEFVDNEVVFDPSVVNIEPNGTSIWARGLSLIAPNTFAYAYQHGSDVMKMAVVGINPENHRMEVLQSPVAVRKGFSPYVSMLSVPYTASDPHTLTLYQSTGTSVVNVCSWNKQGHYLSRCEDFTWLSQSLTSAAGVHLGGGKAFMVFTTSAGTPYYSVFGLSKK